MKKRQGYFSISAVAKMFTVHQQTIRLYEKEGLITPKRTEGNTRMFTQEDVTRLEEVIYLTHELGINLAGVQMILKLQKQIKKMQKDMNKVFNSAQHELTKETEIHKQVIANNARQLLKIKQEQKVHQEPTQQEPLDVDDWKLDYED